MANESILLVSPKKEGNTYEAASYLAKQSGAHLFTIASDGEPDLAKYEHIVLCSGVYGDKVHADLAKWLHSLDAGSLNGSVKFHMFLTWFGRGKSDLHAMEQAERILKEKNLTLNKKYGTCLGGKFIIRKGHPNASDLRQALEWMYEQIKRNS